MLQQLQFLLRRQLFTALLAMLLLPQGGLLAKPKAKPPNSFLVLTIDGVIHGGTVEILKEALKEAKASHQGLILALDTPGGLLESTREIVKLELNSEIPIIVYVSPSGSRAGSAGTFITLAGHIAAMAPGTNIGAAHPVTIGGKDPEKEGGKEMAQKIENDTLAFVETIAKQRGRNIEWAKKAVRESASITEEKALELKVIDLVATSVEDLLKKIEGKKVDLQESKFKLTTSGATVVNMHLPLKLKWLNVLASPTTMFLLIVIFILGVYVEFTHPGMMLPAAASAISLLLLLVASRVMPMSTLGLLLILIGAGLLLAEIYVTSFGLLTVGGLSAFVIGSLLLFDASKSDVRVPILSIVSATIVVGLITAVIGYLVMKSFRLPQVAGQEKLINATAVVEEVLADTQSLRVFIDGEYWNAKVVGEMTVEKGDKVKITDINGLELKVKKDTLV